MRSFRVGLLLAVRQIQRAGIWTTGLIVFVMMLTFLNLIAVSGILVGLIEGAERAVQEHALGDIILTPLDDEDRITNTTAVINTLATFPEISASSVRYNGSAVMEANYKERRNLQDERDSVAVRVSGVNPLDENNMTALSGELQVGEYLDPNEEGYILIGAYYTEEYAQNFGDVFETVSGVGPGDTVRLSVGDKSKEFVVKGIVLSKVDEISLNTYIPEREFRRLFNRLDGDADQIVMRVASDNTPEAVRDKLSATLIADNAKVKTFTESLPKFLIDIKDTFNVLGAFIGSIGLVVASITIFIIIFINALSRRRQIGILKGIGIEQRAIEIAYVLQAGLYALAGSAIGAFITYGILLPYFDANPIQFPFSDGILVAEPLGTLIRFLILFAVTLLAGFIPAWMIVRQNTLNAILGRK